MLTQTINQEAFDALPEVVQKEYEKQTDGTYELLSDSKSKLDEFRGNNRKLFGEVEKLKADLTSLGAKYKDLDPVKAREALEKVQNLEDQKLIDAGKLDELLEQRTERMREKHATEVEKLQAAQTEAGELLDKLVVENAIVAAAVAARVKPAHSVDVLNRLKLKFKRDGIKAVPIDGAFGENGKALEIDEAVADLKTSAPDLFQGSKGGGAGGGDGGEGGFAAGVQKITWSEFAKGDEELHKKVASGEVVVED